MKPNVENEILCSVFTESKARNLIPSWKAIFRVCPSDWCTELYQEAAECMLCLHLGNLKGEIYTFAL